jgi:hypothetical protein
MLSSTRRTCLNSPILELSPIRPHSLVLLKVFKYSPLRLDFSHLGEKGVGYALVTVLGQKR